MFILPPSQKHPLQHPSGGSPVIAPAINLSEPQINLDAVNPITYTLLTFTAPEGTYECRKRVNLAVPTRSLAPEKDLKLTVIDSQLTQTSSLAVSANVNNNTSGNSNVNSNSNGNGNGSGNGNGGQRRSWFFGGSSGPKIEKPKKPKTSLTKNNSSFISKAIVHEKVGSVPRDDYVLIANSGRSISWYDWTELSVNNASKDYFSKVLFTKDTPLCHDFNSFTHETHQALDMIVGMDSGDLLWIDAMCNRYHRINKNGDVLGKANSAMAVQWLPNSPNLFISIHTNGLITLMDKDREDSSFVASGGLLDYDLNQSTDTMQVIKSFTSDQNTSSSSNSTNATRTNPVAVYKVSNERLTSLAFSPDKSTLVVTSADGYLRFLNLQSELITDIFSSYYDGILTCAFSPDGKYLATGGKDDLLTIWSVAGKCMIARGYGHQSWVKKVEFDTVNCDGSLCYRIGSVGEDGNLILWDFSPRILRNRTKLNGSSNKHKHKAKTSSTDSNLTNMQLYLQQQQLYRSGLHDRQDSLSENNTTIDFDQDQDTYETRTTRIHDFVGANQVPSIPPVMILKLIDEGNAPSLNPNENSLDSLPGCSLTDLKFTKNDIIVAGGGCKIWTFKRPVSTEFE